MSAQSPPPSSMPPPTLKRPRQSAAGGAASAAAAGSSSAAGAGGQTAGAPAPRAKRRKPEIYRAEGSGSVGPELGKGGAGKDEVVDGEVKTKIDFNDLPVETLYRYLEYHDLLPRWEPSPWSEEPVMPPSHLYATQPLPYPPYATSLGFGVGPGMGSISGPAGHHLYNVHGASNHPGLNGGADTPPFPGGEYLGQRDGAREDEAEARGHGDVQRAEEREDVVMAEEAQGEVSAPADEVPREAAGGSGVAGAESRPKVDRPADAPIDASTAEPSTAEDPSVPLDPTTAPDSPSAKRSPSPPPPPPPTTRSKTAPSRRPPTPPPPSLPVPAKRSLITLSDVHAARTVFAEKANAHWMRGLGGGQNKESETIVHFLYKMKVGPNRLLRVYNPLLPVPPPW